MLVGLEDNRESAIGIGTGPACDGSSWASCSGSEEPGWPFTFLWISVAARVAAPEGHAVIAVRDNETGFANEEAAVDAIAGELDAVRGRDRALVRLVFEAIGCDGPWCDHPPPAGRAEAYDYGYSTREAWNRARRLALQLLRDLREQLALRFRAPVGDPRPMPAEGLRQRLVVRHVEFEPTGNGDSEQHDVEAVARGAQAFDDGPRECSHHLELALGAHDGSTSCTA